MENVFRISPLAISLVKPPDPEILKGLPLNAQRELTAQYAEACLSQQGSRAGSRASSRPGSQAGSRRGSIEESEESKTETKGQWISFSYFFLSLFLYFPMNGFQLNYC